MKNLTTETKAEIASLIIDAINDNRITDINEIHQEVFNTDYFIIGTYQAKKWLEDNYGVFEAIEKVREYETDNFGEMTTKIAPEEIVNMLVYIIGEEIISEIEAIAENWESSINEDIAQKIIVDIHNL